MLARHESRTVFLYSTVVCTTTICPGCLRMYLERQDVDVSDIGDG